MRHIIFIGAAILETTQFVLLTLSYECIISNAWLKFDTKVSIRPLSFAAPPDHCLLLRFPLTVLLTIFWVCAELLVPLT